MLVTKGQPAMSKDLLRNRTAAPIGSREWLDRQLRDQEADWDNVLPAAAKSRVTDRMPIPETMRQFYREIGRQGGLERSRRFARRFPRCWRRFHQLYHCDPNRVKARPARATPEQRRYLRANAIRGGQARARKCSPERRKAIAAMGGRAKAAQRRRASSPAQSVAGKQE